MAVQHEDVRLSTKDGGYFTTVKLEINGPWPQTVVYGTRVFTRYQMGEYREATSYFVPTLEPEEAA